MFSTAVGNMCACSFLVGARVELLWQTYCHGMPKPPAQPNPENHRSCRLLRCWSERQRRGAPRDQPKNCFHKPRPTARILDSLVKRLVWDLRVQRSPVTVQLRFKSDRLPGWRLCGTLG